MLNKTPGTRANTSPSACLFFSCLSLLSDSRQQKFYLPVHGSGSRSDQMMWLQTLLLLGLVGLMLDVCYGYSSEDEDYYMQELLSREHYQRVSEDRATDGRQTPGRGFGKESRSISAASKAAGGSDSASGNVNTRNWLRLILSSCLLACRHVRCHRVPSLNPMCLFR